MDRITQLQDEIQRVRNDPTRIDTRIDVTHNPQQLLMIMSSSIAYLTSRSTFLQVSPDIPVTKTRNPDKFDPPEVFEGETPPSSRPSFVRVVVAHSVRSPPCQQTRASSSTT